MVVGMYLSLNVGEKIDVIIRKLIPIVLVLIFKLCENMHLFTITPFPFSGNFIHEKDFKSLSSINEVKENEINNNFLVVGSLWNLWKSYLLLAVVVNMASFVVHM